MPGESVLEDDRTAISATMPIEGSVGKRAVRGALLLTGATYIALILGIVARKVLSHLLTPEEFGLINASLSLVDLVVAFGAFSFSSAIINVRDNLVAQPLPHLRENVFILTIAVGVLLSLVAIVVAVVAAPGAGGALMLALVSIYAVHRLFASLDTFYTQMLERRLSYEKISRVTLLTSVVLHVGAVLLAAGGYPVWSIPVATLVSVVVSALLHRHYVRGAGIEAVKQRPWRYADRGTMAWLWKFGIKVLFNRLFESWLFRLDNVVILGALGIGILGYYSQAFVLAQMPAIALAPIVARVSIAAYAEIQHDAVRLEEAFAFTNFFLVRALVPITLVVLLASKELVRLFLSEQWLPAAEVLAALSGVVLTVSLFENAKMLLGSLLRLLEISLVRGVQLVLLALSLFVYAERGLVVASRFVSAVHVLGCIAIFVLVSREIGVRFRRYFLPPVVIGSLVALPLWFLHRALAPANDLDLTALSSFGILATITVATSVLVWGLEILLQRTFVMEHIRLLRSRLKK